MGGATNRFFTLLSATTTTSAAPTLLRHRTRCSSLIFLPRLRRRYHYYLAVPSSASSSRRYHSHSRCSGAVAATASLHHQDYQSSPSPPHHEPWPEWSRLLENLSAAGYYDRRLEPRVGDELLLATSPEFARAATVCLEYARERPGLVRLLSKRDMEIVIGNGTPFLFKSANETSGLDVDGVNTVNLMKFVLSYASNLDFPSSESGQINNRGFVESSVRKLLGEMAKLCYVVPNSNSFGPTQDKYSDRDGEADTRPSRQRIEMKRGDWNCPRCSFMNFARNMKCLECEEARPKNQLTGGEWECPQCDFFNYGRNTSCLRCDCKRPGEVPMNTSGSRFSTGLDNQNNLASNEEKAQRWFSKISKLENSPDPAGTEVVDDDFPEIMPLRKGVNRFVVSTRKTPVESRLDNSQYQTNSDGSSGSRNSTYVPFVPLPADMFAKKPPAPESEKIDKPDPISTSPLQTSQNEPDADEDQSQESDKWFQKITELHRSIDDRSDPTPDENTPETMPVRRGENRFVLGKAKDRSLSSPAYKRQAAMEKSSEAKFVPFVPFPPDYFAKKDEKPQTTPKPATEEVVQSQVQNSEIRKTSIGKSLEGSAVKEPDPLDMSEEAKAERWFRRVSQIKDISELSQIPDEDFPSIMPMRKGVNRFVVSKRKTPLERRLTSPQYKRNLPVVGSQPIKNDNESS